MNHTWSSVYHGTNRIMQLNFFGVPNHMCSALRSSATLVDVNAYQETRMITPNSVVPRLSQHFFSPHFSEMKANFLRDVLAEVEGKDSDLG